MASTKPSTLKPAISLGQTFAALKHPNYRLWFIGQLISLIGTWTQSTAQNYLIYDLTKDPAFLGYAGFANGLPAWLFTLYGGVISDRIPRRKLMIITQTSMLILAFIMAALVFSNQIQSWQILVLAFLLGVANAFDAPARMSFVVELVDDRADLTNAIALNASMFNLAAVIGPVAGGAIYALIGPGWCFTINGISFIAVIIALLLMKLAQIPQTPKKGTAFQELSEGFRYLAKEKILLVLFFTVGMISVLGMGLITLLPAWAVKILHGDVTTNAWLLTARGLGAFIGAISIATFGHLKIRGKMVSAGALALPVLFILMAFTNTLFPALILLLGIGFSFMAVVNSANALVQSHLPDHLRGRVMAIYSLVFMGGMPIGSLLAGTIASSVGEPETVLICSSVLLVITILLFWKVPQIQKLG